MPSQLEGFKIAERAPISQKKMAIAMIVALLVATPASFWAYLHLIYQHGAVRTEGYIIGIGIETFERMLLPWLEQPHTTDSTGLSFTAFASLFTLGLNVSEKAIYLVSFPSSGLCARFIRRNGLGLECCLCGLDYQGDPPQIRGVTHLSAGGSVLCWRDSRRLSDRNVLEFSGRGFRDTGISGLVLRTVGELNF